MNILKMDGKGSPMSQDTLKMTDKPIFFDRFRNREHQCNVRLDQRSLRVIFHPQLINLPGIDIWVMNQYVHHLHECFITQGCFTFIS